jgi:hypothetical protein
LDRSILRNAGGSRADSYCTGNCQCELCCQRLVKNPYIDPKLCCAKNPNMTIIEITGGMLSGIGSTTAWKLVWAPRLVNRFSQAHPHPRKPHYLGAFDDASRLVPSSGTFPGLRVPMSTMRQWTMRLNSRRKIRSNATPLCNAPRLHNLHTPPFRYPERYLK